MTFVVKFVIAATVAALGYYAGLFWTAGMLAVCVYCAISLLQRVAYEKGSDDAEDLYYDTWPCPR